VILLENNYLKKFYQHKLLDDYQFLDDLLIIHRELDEINPIGNPLGIPRIYVIPKAALIIGGVNNVLVGIINLDFNLRRIVQINGQLGRLPGLKPERIRINDGLVDGRLVSRGVRQCNIVKIGS
jgi:hypothetical protein